MKASAPLHPSLLDRAPLIRDRQLLPALERTEHRPWPLPREGWVMAMHWHDLLFAHWPVPPESLRAHIPPPLELDTFDGMAWIGVVPFRMSGVRARQCPRAAGFAFPELNVRTYVKSPGRTGVWFFSLDASSRLAVRSARWWYHLPYYNARMQCREVDGFIQYKSARAHRGVPAAEFQARYRAAGAVFHPAPGTFDYWLTERYCLYAINRRREVRVGEIHHPPWPLQPAEGEILQCTMTEPLGIRLAASQTVLHFARHQPVIAWRLAPMTSPFQPVG